MRVVGVTATDELREGLTKRGIKWHWEDERTTFWYATVDGEEWGEWTATEMGGYLLLSFTSGDLLTPAQAIAATLGESMTDTEKAALEKRIDELCAEVERGKAEFKKMDVWHSQELKAAMDENAKLRNILAHAVMLVDLYEGLTNTRLSLDGGIVDCDWLRAWCKKLGIEVPE